MTMKTITPASHPKHWRKYHRGFVRMDGMPDWNVIFFRSFKKAREYALEVNTRSELPKARAYRLTTTVDPFTQP
jgi:hypothetical protein